MKKWADWSNWNGKVDGASSEPLNKSFQKGAEVAKEALTTGNLPILRDAPPQPTNEQLFGHLVPTEETLKKNESDWDNRFKNHFDGLKQKIDHLNKSKVDDKKWGYGKSFNSLLKSELSEEEMTARNMDVSET